MALSLRPYRTDDQNFLFKLYAATRQQEISAWGWSSAQQEAFLRMQFNAQQQSYGMTYADADHQIVVFDDNPIGRILVLRKPEAALLVDIALLPEYRSRGIGAAGPGTDRAMQQKQSCSQAASVKNHPAQRLYERLDSARPGKMNCTSRWSGQLVRVRRTGGRAGERAGEERPLGP